MVRDNIGGDGVVNSGDSSAGNKVVMLDNAESDDVMVWDDAS